MASINHIPLKCRICPKKPDFSDISHLLTHVASKSHLSNYYKMKVQGTTDHRSRECVEEYDDWYSEHSIDDLMRERLNAKDRRITGSRNGINGTRRGSGATGSASARGTPVPNGRRGAPRPLRDSVLNPQLNGSIKTEPKSRSATPASVFSIEPMNVFGARYAAPMWPNSPYAGSPMKQETLSSSRSDDDDDSFVLDPEPQHRRGRKRRNNSDSIDSLLIDDDDEMGETTTDAAKLKGVYWPGMAMFDSATSDMRRKRNQKKDYSVIEQLMATSEDVEPTEMIFDEYGAFRKERVITGNADLEDDDSLLSGEIEPEPEPLVKKRVVRRPRQALAEKNVNTGRILRRRHGGPHHPGGKERPRGPYFDGAAADDDDLTYCATRPKKRSTLSIHRDNSGPDITFEQPAPMMNYLTSGFRNAPQQNNVNHNPLMSSGGMFGRSHNRVPSYSFGSNPFGNTFRPASSGQAMPMPNYGSFGQLNHQTFFPNNSNQLPTLHGQAGYNAIQQHFGPSTTQQHQPASYNNTNTNNLWQPQPQHHNSINSQQNFDILAGLQNDVGMQGNGVENGFGLGAEFNNPLFFSSTHPTPPGDEDGTISAPASERSR